MSTPAGWYDDGSGRQRWWDGNAWTDQFADEQRAPKHDERSAPKHGFLDRAMGSASAALSEFAAKSDPGTIEGTLWSAVGKPLTGMGAGRYRVTQEYLIFEKGTLSTQSHQIRMREIADVDAKQSLSQKARGVGTIVLRVIRPTGDEKVLLEDIPNFREGVDIINRLSDEARQRQRTAENTQNVNYTGAHAYAPTPAPAAAPAESTPAGDLNAEVARLADFHQQGILSDEEFAAAKKRLLGL